MEIIIILLCLYVIFLPSCSRDYTNDELGLPEDWNKNNND